MSKYLFIANYSADGVKGILKEGGSGRREAVTALAKSVGGSLESLYFAFGGDDVFAVCDLPDDEAAAAVALTVGASGTTTVRTVTLLTTEQIDAATKRSPAYRAPGA